MIAYIFYMIIWFIFTQPNIMYRFRYHYFPFQNSYVKYIFIKVTLESLTMFNSILFLRSTIFLFKAIENHAEQKQRIQ